MDGNVTISKNAFFSLRVADEKLYRLECGGVDNWDWYGESLNQDDDMPFDEWEEAEKERIKKM